MDLTYNRLTHPTKSAEFVVTNRFHISNMYAKIFAKYSHLLVVPDSP